jgi:hypothetical protein
MVVNHGERMTLCSTRELNPSLEIHLPQKVRRRLLKSLIALSTTTTWRTNAAAATQDRVYRGIRWSLVSSSFEAPHDLARSPGRVSIAHRQNKGLCLSVGALRTEVRTP